MLCNRPDTPLKYPLLVGGLGHPHSHLIHGLRLATLNEASQTASRSVQPLFLGSQVWQTDRQTADHAARSVTIDRIYTYAVPPCSLRKKAINRGKSYKPMRRNISPAIYEETLGCTISFAWVYPSVKQIILKMRKKYAYTKSGILACASSNRNFPISKYYFITVAFVLFHRFLGDRV